MHDELTDRTVASQPPRRAVERTAWAVGAFYALVAFEFFYMASPFAAYLYGAYLPGLDFLNRVPRLAWLTEFYLPHFATTSSALVNAAPALGAWLTWAGVLGFLFGAAQVYSRKLRRKGAAVGGVYRFVRHPQYASLVVAGAGMLLVWPRFVMLPSFAAMLLVYRALAWAEERECLRKFGQAYADYQERTPRFLPFRLPSVGARLSAVRYRPARLAVAALCCAAGLALAFGIAFGARAYTLRHLVTYRAGEALYVALTPLDGASLARLASSGEADPRVAERLAGAAAEGAHLVAYVMPWEWTVPEVPMNGVRDHLAPAGYDRRRHKIAYSKAVLRSHGDVQGLAVLGDAMRTEPLGEAWIDEEGRVARVLDPPARTFYGKVPVPVF